MAGKSKADPLWLRRQIPAIGTVALLGALCLLATACTPIGDVSSRSKASSEDEAGNSDVPVSDAGVSGGKRAAQVGQSAVRAETACTQQNARSCGATPVEVLVCHDGLWQRDEPCNPGESCVSGAEAVSCRPVLAECVEQEPGFVYCDDDAQRRVCIDASHSKELPCDALERCVMVEGQPKCRCIPGAIFEQGCVLATSCSEQNGGCDALTMCMPGSNGRKCSACPTGYLGDGEHGCEPQLLSLKTSCPELSPALAAGVYDYRVRVPFVCQQLQIDGSAPAGSTVKVFMDELPASWSWQLSPVKQGETQLPIQVTSQFGVTTKYSITVERTGGQQAYLKASNADADDCFGFGLAASDEQVLVGAMREDGASASDPSNNDAADSGAVYVFAPQGDSWTQQEYLKASPSQAGEYFGSSLAMTTDTLIVGAPNRDPLAWYGGQAAATRIGAVYVFTRVNGTGAWTQKARLTPSSGSQGDLFGYSVALREDTLLVGAPGDNSDGTRAGAVYVYRRQGESWVESQKLLGDAGTDGKFGMAVALDANPANRLVVGAPHESSQANLAGAAFTFVRDGDQWRQEQRLVPTTSTTEMTFGWHVMIEGDLIMVAAPGVVRVGPPGEVLSFERVSGSWTQVRHLTAKFPNAADLYGGGLARRGSLLVVGANGDSSGARNIDGDASRTDAYQAGAAYVYVTTDQGRNWVPTNYLKASYPDPDDSFGENITMNASAIFVAAPLEGSSARAVNGDANNNNAARSGAVYVFK